MPITAEPGAIAPRLSHVAKGSQPDLPFHVLLEISPPAARAMRSAVELAALNDFIAKIGFHTDNKNVLHIGNIDPRPDLYLNPTPSILGHIAAVKFAEVRLGPHVTVTGYAPERWPGYVVFHIKDTNNLGLHDIPDRNWFHLFKIVN